MSVVSLDAWANDLGQEPSAALSLVNPVFDQTGRSNVVVLFTQLVRGTQVSGQFQIVRAKLNQHVLRRDAFVVAVLEPQMLGDITDGSDCSSTDFARSLGDIVRHREDLSTMLIEQEVVISEMRAIDVPMEILRLDIESEHVGEQFAQLAGDLYDGIAPQVC